jgi:predicted RNA binding protein YcfA (HicA-like mRNA interferase family)
MSRWPSTQASRVLSAVLRIGWQIKRTTGSHRVFEEIGPRMLARLGKVTGLKPKDL